MSESGSTRAESVLIEAGSGLRGEFALPGDKSISHRSALFGALGDGESRIANYSTARDCQSTLDCLEALGVRITRSASLVTIAGVGLGGLRPSTAMLDAGNSGSTIRMLSGILAGQPFVTRITGDESIQRRPMKRVIDPLRLMGARIEARDGNFAPLEISGGGLKGIEYAPPVASAQVKSCVLLAGLFAEGTTRVLERTPTRNHTEAMLRECGARFTSRSTDDGEILEVSGGGSLRALGDYTVAGDLSSAAFFLGAGVMVPGSAIRLRHIGINPSRLALVEVLQRMGGKVAMTASRIEHGEPVADLTAESSRLEGDHELSGALIANLIDEIPILAVIATRLHGRLTIREAGELRVKESDRIRAIVDNLRRMGIRIEEFDDGFVMEGPQQAVGATIDSHGDHRIAMSFAVAGLVAEGQTRIDGAEAASVSLPEFYRLLGSMGASVTEVSGESGADRG